MIAAEQILATALLSGPCAACGAPVGDTGAYCLGCQSPDGRTDYKGAHALCSACLAALTSDCDAFFGALEIEIERAGHG